MFKTDFPAVNAKMTNSILHKLRQSKTTVGEAGKLLAQHIGPGTNEMHCEEALAAVATARNESVKSQARVVALLFPKAGICELAAITAAQLNASADTTTQFPLTIELF